MTPSAGRRDCRSWTVDHAGCLGTLHSPEDQDCSGKTLEEGLAWCLVRLMVKGTPGDWGLGPGTRRVLTGDMSWVSARFWSERLTRLAIVAGVLALALLNSGQSRHS
jgi:hypothetical protein